MKHKLLLLCQMDIAIEFNQQYIPLRSFELINILANTRGAILLLLAFYVGERYFFN